MMKSSIRARVSAIVKKGFCFKASRRDQLLKDEGFLAKDYCLIKPSVESSILEFNPKKGFTLTKTFTNNTDFHSAYIIRTSHRDLYYITPNTFIVKPHTTCTVTITRMVQDQVLTAEEYISIESIYVPKAKHAEAIKSLYSFKLKDYYILKKPKVCLDVDPMILETRSEVEETAVTIVQTIASL